MSQSVEDPPIEEAGDKAEAEQPPQARQDKDDKPLSEEDALRALHRKGESEDEAERAEAARAAAIAASVMERLNADPFGMRIGTVALFNDAVSFGGGMNLGDGARRTGQPTARISERRLAHWTEGHLPLPRFDEALRILVGRRLLILALPPGGRKATGVNLLVKAVNEQAAVRERAVGAQEAGQTVKGGGCHEVLDASALRDTQWRPPERNSGYLLVLDDATPGLTPHLIDERWIDDLTACLNEHESYLVLVTGPPRGALMEAERSGQVLTTLGGLDLVRLIERRVHDREPTPEESADLRLRLIEAGALELLREDTRPRTALHLATVIRERADLAAKVKELRDPTGRVHDWFSRHRTPEAMCFALAAAALEDATYLTVSDAAAQLYDLLTPAAEAPPDLRFRERIGSDHPWIDVSVGSGGPGDVAPRVRYLNPLVRQAVLGYAWTYLDGQRSAFLAWIRRLVAHPDIGVRARTSVAAGVIAWSDYDHALHRFLRPWARHGSVVVRQSAATALDVVGGHPDLAEAVWLLLEAWVAEGDTAEQRRQGLTAAAVLGGGLGAARPRRAVKALRVLLDRDDWGTLLPVGHALSGLMERGRVAEVLAALVEWSQPRDASPMVTKALAAFVFVAAQPVAQPVAQSAAQSAAQSPAQPAGEASGQGHQSLPLLLAGAEEHRSQLIELWARALDRRPAQQPALETLREYVDVHADRDAAAYRGVRDIVLAVAARSGRHRERLHHHLDDWARAAGRRDHPAARLLAELGRSSYANGRT